MKKVLFVMQAMGMGGSYTSLLNLLELMKEQGIPADLFLMEHDGMFLDRARETANLLPEDRILGAIRCNKSRLHEYGIQGYVVRLLFTVGHRVIPAEKILAWIYRRRAAKLTGYDAVIAYQEEIPTAFSQYIPASRRIAWCHMDYGAFSVNRSKVEQRRLYRQFDEIACVSNVIKDSLVSNLECPQEKIHVIYNTLPPKFILSQAGQQVNMGDFTKKGFTFVSMGRFVKRKRFDRIVYAAAVLKKKGYTCTWYILGDGEEFNTIAEMAEQYGVRDEVRLLGSKANPFPYVKEADCYIMSSENEGQPMVMNEALTLSVPVITTDFPSAREVVQDRVNGIIGANSAEGLVDAVLSYVSDPELRKRLHTEATYFMYDNDKILHQVMSILE